MKIGCSVVKVSMRPVALTFSLTFLLFAAGEIPAGEKQKPLKLEHADRLISSGENSEIVNLVGNVHLSHEDIDLYSNRATWYRKSGLVQFLDSVLVIDEERRITAQTVTYYRRDKRVTARGDVKMEDSEENILLICDDADYFRQNRQLNAVGDPILVINPYDDSAKMEIRARRMEYFGEEDRGVAHDSVEIIKKQMNATSGRAEFFKAPERAILTIDPLVIYGENELTGDTISIFTHEKQMDRLLVKGDARAFYKMQPDTLVEDYTTAELTGRKLEAFFTEDEIQKAVMRNNAISVYIPAITDTLTRGINTASGDSITLYFEEDLIQRVFISGGARGHYVEPKFEEDAEEPKYDTTRYSGSEIDYRFDESEINLFENAELRYQDMILNAGDIRYGIDTRILSARGIIADSTEEEIDTPVLLQGNEKLEGRKMTYNMDTKKGQVTLARTKYEGGFYRGEKIRQVSEDVLFVSQGNYTSCDDPEYPHYHFHSDRMKMIGKDKVVARPVILYIGDLPVFAVPYYVFPVRKGRQSGFLTFEIGNFERGERFIRDLGYYWAASEYWDLATSLDFYENVRTILNTNVRYSLRYRLNGSVGMNFARETDWVDYKRSLRTRWRINFAHRQTLSQTTNLAASGSFVSDKSYIEDNVYDAEERLDRTVRSNANLTKKWKSSSLVIAADQTWNLDTDVKRQLLPSITFSRSSLPIFAEPGKSAVKNRVKPWEEPEEIKKRFYHSIYFSIRSTGKNFRQRSQNTDYWKEHQTVHTTSSLSSPQKLLGIMTVNPGINLTHTIYHVEWNPKVDSLNLETDRLFTRKTYNLNVSTKTSIYGTVYPNVLGVAGLRHVITPSVSYRFTPEVEENEEYRSYTGVGTGSRRSKSLSYSLGNLFQAKYISGDNEKKIDLFTMNFSGSYNFAAEEKKIGDLASSIRTAAIPYVDLDYNASYSFYNFDDSRRPLTNPRLKNASINTTIRGRYRPGKQDEDQDIDSPSGKRSREGLPGRGKPAATGFSGVGMDFTLKHRYQISKGIAGTTKKQWLNLGLQMQPTSGWKISYNCQYDMKDKRIASQSMDISRDLHCWEGIFTWIPSGRIAGYYIRINIKSLPDIKIEKSEGSVRGGYH
jgi:lipopolysaccharide assembly outer membrane protein LptD (OstA)